MDNIQSWLTALWQTLLSLVKISLQSKINLKFPIVASGSEIVILGNGPSLNSTIAESSDFLGTRDLLAVNFAANADIFTELKPKYYILADPHFFVAFEQPNVKKLWERLSIVDWEMRLYIPTKLSLTDSAIANLCSRPSVKICRYNTTPVEGFKWFENFAFAHNLGMPRPRNVLIPSIMVALAMKYKTIYIAGADHSWTKTLSVNDENQVVSIQPHFYKEEEKEVKRVNTEYMNYPLHQIMYSFHVAFKSYFTIERYAKHIKASIYNITPNSFIDAFARKKI